MIYDLRFMIYDLRRRAAGFLLLFAILFATAPARADVTNVEVLVTYTNMVRGVTNGDTLTITGDTRRYTNGVLNAVGTWIQSTNLVGWVATNTQIHLSTYTPAGIERVFSTNTNAIVIVSLNGVFPTVTLSAGVGTVTYGTNVWGDESILRFPQGALYNEADRTNNVSGLIGLLNDTGGRASNTVANGILALSNLIDRISQQVISNKVAYLFTNYGGLLDGPRITNAVAIHGSNGTLTAITFIGGTYAGIISSLTNGTLYSNALHWVRITNGVALHGTVFLFKDGTYTNATLDRPISTNLVNYGSAIRSEGTGGNSLQVGSNALASGEFAMAIGNSAVASGAQSTAIGVGALATNDYASVFGSGSIAGIYGAALGANTFATNSATAVGVSSAAYGLASFAANAAAVWSPYEIAIGGGIESFSPFGVHLGFSSGGNATFNVTLGAYSIASHSNSAALGPPDHAGTATATTTTNQIRLGTANHSVSIPGTLSAVGVSNLTTIVGSTNTINGDLSFTKSTYTTASSSTNNNINLGANVFTEVTAGPTAAWIVGAFSGNTASGNFRMVKNGTGYDATVVNNDGGFTASARVTTLTGGSMSWPASSFLFLIYDTASSRWIMQIPPLANALTATATNAVTLGENLGLTNATRMGVFYQVQGQTNIQFRSLQAGSGMVLTNEGTNIVIAGTVITNYLPLRPTRFTPAPTNFAYADETLQTPFLSFPHTNGVGTVIALAATAGELWLPNDYATNTLAIELSAIITATNGPNASNAIFQATILRHNTTGQTSTNDAMIGPFDAGSSTYTFAITASFTGTNKVQTVSGVITNCTLAAGESFSLKLERLNANAADLIGSGVVGITTARLRYTRP